MRYYTQIECRNRRGKNRNGKKVTGLLFIPFDRLGETSITSTSNHNSSNNQSSVSSDGGGGNDDLNNNNSKRPMSRTIGGGRSSSERCDDLRWFGLIHLYSLITHFNLFLFLFQYIYHEYLSLLKIINL